MLETPKKLKFKEIKKKSISGFLLVLASTNFIIYI